MDVSFKHKGLELFYSKNSTAKIQATHAKKLRRILTALDDAKTVEDMDIPSFKLHELKGDRSGTWSVTVNGNWRVTFEANDGRAEIVDYEDYH